MATELTAQKSVEELAEQAKWLRSREWVLMQWRKGVDVFTPYISGPRYWADNTQGFSADWVEIANGDYDYIHTLKRVLEQQLNYEQKG